MVTSSALNDRILLVWYTLTVYNGSTVNKEYVTWMIDNFEIQQILNKSRDLAKIHVVSTGKDSIKTKGARW